MLEFSEKIIIKSKYTVDKLLEQAKSAPAVATVYFTDILHHARNEQRIRRMGAYCTE